MHVYMGGYTHVCRYICAWCRGQNLTSGFFLGLFPTYMSGSPSWTQCSPVWLALHTVGSRDAKSLFLSAGIIGVCFFIQCVGFGGFSQGPCAWLASTLLTELRLHASNLLLYKVSLTPAMRTVYSDEHNPHDPVISLGFHLPALQYWCINFWHMNFRKH